MRHLDDAELLGYVDGEHPPEAEQWRQHLEACDACRLEVAAIQAESARFSGWLARADFEADLDPTPALDPGLAGTPGTGRSGAGSAVRTLTRANTAPPDRRIAARLVGSPWLKAAVIVLLLAAPLAAFPGVRAWVVDRVTGEVETPVPAAVEATGGLVRFEPAAGSFTVRVEGALQGSTLLLERVDGPEAVLRVDGDAEPVVSAELLRIRAAEPGIGYRLAVPPAVSEVRVQAGDREVRVTGQELDAGRTVELGDG